MGAGDARVLGSTVSPIKGCRFEVCEDDVCEHMSSHGPLSLFAPPVFARARIHEISVVSDGDEHFAPAGPSQGVPVAQSRQAESSAGVAVLVEG